MGCHQPEGFGYPYPTTPIITFKNQDLFKSTYLVLSVSSIVSPTARDAVVGRTLNVVSVKSFREDGKSGENDEGREELHG